VCARVWGCAGVAGVGGVSESGVCERRRLEMAAAAAAAQERGPPTAAGRARPDTARPGRDGLCATNNRLGTGTDKGNLTV
jgi:hypothetical protein